MTDLELLAPARNADIGIAAIDCGADAVYIAGPEFGARHSAGNSMEEVGRLCEYAHRFGARIFLTLNTILFNYELPEAGKLLGEAKKAGVDGIIAQDLSLVGMTDLPLHASTQCAIRTPEKASFYEGLGFRRLVLERQISLEEIKAIRASVDCELEFFVHGALCVCYSGQCYMSESISGRSANRGACVQACRSSYDLVDESGKMIVKDRALLSLKDFNLISSLEALASAGICSFKIEGRLKNINYVRNTVRAYSMALDSLVAANPGKYRRASFGKVSGGFTPDLLKTFNRGYTSLFIDGKRGEWSSMDTPKSIGELAGTVTSIRPGCITFKPTVPALTLHNGDGFSFTLSSGQMAGFRSDRCEGTNIYCKSVEGLHPGARIYRNKAVTFEKTLERNLPQRLLEARISLDFSESGVLEARAVSEDGRAVSIAAPCPVEVAGNRERMVTVLKNQIGKTSGMYRFDLEDIAPDSPVPFLPVSFINGIRRSLASSLDKEPCIPLKAYVRGPEAKAPTLGGRAITYKDNVSNDMAKEIYRSCGAGEISMAYENTHAKGVELMRMKYCIRHELGICPVRQKGGRPGRLFLSNNGRRYELHFDCGKCEMSITADQP